MPTILIADDEPAFRKINRRYLEISGFDEDRGFRYIEAEGGEEAWDLYRSENPDFMILDDRMKDSTRGIEVAKRVREGYNGSEPDIDTGILIISGTLLKNEVPDNVGFLFKLYVSDDLVNKVRRYFDSVSRPKEVPLSEAETVVDMEVPNIQKSPDVDYQLEDQ